MVQNYYTTKQQHPLKHPNIRRDSTATPSNNNAPLTTPTSARILLLRHQTATPSQPPQHPQGFCCYTIKQQRPLKHPNIRRDSVATPPNSNAPSTTPTSTGILRSTCERLRSASRDKVCRFFSGLTILASRTSAGEASMGRVVSSSSSGCSSSRPW